MIIAHQSYAKNLRLYLWEIIQNKKNKMHYRVHYL